MLLGHSLVTLGRTKWRRRTFTLRLRGKPPLKEVSTAYFSSVDGSWIRLPPAPIYLAHVLVEFAYPTAENRRGLGAMKKTSQWGTNAKPRSWFLCRGAGRGHLVDAMADPPSFPELGARLALTRWPLDLTRFQMARLLSTDTATWGVYEAGLQRIPVDQTLKLSAYGIPLEWVFQGKMANLHPTSAPKFASSMRSGRGYGRQEKAPS